MQIKNNNANNLQNRWIIGSIKWVLLVGCLYFIITRFQDQSINLNEIEWPNSIGLTLGFVFFLMILNWYLEALRWKVSLQSFDPISIKRAWNVILSGLALNWILPFTSGDLIARIFQQRDKYQTSSAAMLNRGIMLGFTLILGFYGVSHLAIDTTWDGLLSVIIIAGIGITLFVFRKSLSGFLQYFQELSSASFIKITILSLMRYVVFVVQFYLLLVVFMPEAEPTLLIAGIGWIFLIRSALPLFFGGVGVREASGILFFEPHIADLQLVLIPVFLIWIINTVIPSLVGLIFVWRTKLFFR